MQRPERSSEETVGGGWRRKGGLETPLEGRWVGENKKLIFAPPLWYDVLVVACLVIGFAVAVGSLVGRGLPVLGEVTASLFLGAAVFLAGLWAAFSNERMVCDLQTRRYARLEGQGLVKRIVRGPLSDLDAIVVVAEEYPFALGRAVTYRTVLHWKYQRHPMLIIERTQTQLPSGAPIQSAAGANLQRAQRYARELGTRFYDNAYFNSPGPLPII